jgi:hypothetical protein
MGLSAFAVGEIPRLAGDFTDHFAWRNDRNPGLVGALRAR